MNLSNSENTTLFDYLSDYSIITPLNYKDILCINGRYNEIYIVLIGSGFLSITLRDLESYCLNLGWGTTDLEYSFLTYCSFNKMIDLGDGNSVIILEFYGVDSQSFNTLKNYKPTDKVMLEKDFISYILEVFGSHINKKAFLKAP